MTFLFIASSMDKEELIAFYLDLCYSYKLIIKFLAVDGVCISLRQLKRYLKKLHLRRKWQSFNSALIEGTIAAIKAST